MAQSITTIAGNGTPGSAGDGGPAVNAELNLPNGVAVDLMGDLYISDGASNTIRKVVNPTGLNTDIITTFAGNGRRGFRGDGGPAAAAELNRPSGVATDSRGDVFIADTGNNRVREVLSSGTIMTIAGNGLCGRRVPIRNGQPATEASLCQPSGIAVDGDNVYISDSGHDQVRVVDSAGVIHAFVGQEGGGSGRPDEMNGDKGQAQDPVLGLPTGLAVDANHDVFIADSRDCVVWEAPSHAGLLTVAGNGHCGYAGDDHQATHARLNHPTGVGVDQMGDLYIADTSNNRLREVKQNGVIATVAGTGRFGFSGDGGLADRARLAFPVGSLAVSSSAIYFSDTFNSRVRGVFTGPPPVLPETPWAIALPVVALMLMAGAYVLLRRRRLRRSV
jgi:hypothetical protein